MIRWRRNILIACALGLAVSAAASAAEALGSCPAWEVNHFLVLARYSQDAYADDNPLVERGASGCAALMATDVHGNLIIAFRGTAIGERSPDRPPLSAFRRKSIKNAYKDWVETNLKQAAGFLPKQYLEAIDMVRARVQALPPDKQVFLTGHSKGGGAAEYAAVAMQADPTLTPEQKARIYCTTFNAAIVRSTNWERLFRQFPGASPEGIRQAMAAPGKLIAVTMAGDPVSQIASGDRAFFGRHVVIEPTDYRDALEQHEIATVIEELTAAVAARPAPGR